jgi:hypothetical protein
MTATEALAVFFMIIGGLFIAAILIDWDDDKPGRQSFKDRKRKNG